MAPAHPPCADRVPSCYALFWQVQVRLRTYLQSNPVLPPVVLHCCTYYHCFIYVLEYLLFSVVLLCSTPRWLLNLPARTECPSCYALVWQVQVRLRTYLQSSPVLLFVVLHCCTYYHCFMYELQYLIFSVVLLCIFFFFFNPPADGEK